MSKLYNALQDQLKTEYKKEAEDCIKIYNVLKAISREKYGEEHVWSSDWNVLTTTMLVESYPNVRKMYKPSHIGKVFLIGILFDESGEIKLWECKIHIKDIGVLLRARHGFLYILVRVILTNPHPLSTTQILLARVKQISTRLGKLLDLYILKNSSLNIFAVLQNNQNLSSYQEI